MIQFCTSDSPRILPVAEDLAQLLVADLGQRRVHHQDQPDGDGDGGRPDAEAVEEGHDAGKQRTRRQRPPPWRGRSTASGSGRGSTAVSVASPVPSGRWLNPHLCSSTSPSLKLLHETPALRTAATGTAHTACKPDIGFDLGQQLSADSETLQQLAMQGALSWRELVKHPQAVLPRFHEP